MSKAALLKITNPLLAVSVLAQAVSGIGRDKMSEEAFETIHGGGGILLVVLVLVHLVLNWSWVRSVYGRKKAA